ncbi:phosphoribosyltransferase [Ruminiclostridium cellulolyticum H10]|uniref:Phosphoribosyltransferase n=1 Tax=Ruminiclostridium cellulolyticum (strain ATCC 35319 / DSM 5812 / JCM 6584 / H10) TaxID=394503 RepID=B8I4C4_RUMCH|nr:phosphoribosyltransferase [Ruminiclostridium cellulolyticum H10]
MIEYFFPPRCALCNAILKAGVAIYICEKCAGEIGYYKNSVTPLNLPVGIQNYCDGILCVGRYSDSLKEALRRFKFSNKPSYYRTFGRLLALKVENTEQKVRFDIIVPVPLYKSKEKTRGYNQAELMAGQVSKILNVPCEKRLLNKTFETKSQSILKKNERLLNLQDAFVAINQRMIVNKNILLIDDILTTGSTVNQCCKALKEAGAGKVIAGVVATTRNY